MQPLHRATPQRLFGDGILRDAEIDGEYRYSLLRAWAPERGGVAWVMFNPSTAGVLEDDPTIRRCMRFTEAWGFGALQVANLYALRAPEPWRVLQHADPVGPGNDAAIVRVLTGAQVVVAAWGTLIGPRHQARVDFVRGAVAKTGLLFECLGQTFYGHPKHPLYLAGDTPRRAFRKVG